MKIFGLLSLWAFELGVLFLLYRTVHFDGMWFFLVTGGFFFAYVIHLFAQVSEYRREYNYEQFLEKKFSPDSFDDRI